MQSTARTTAQHASTSSALVLSHAEATTGTARLPSTSSGSGSASERSRTAPNVLQAILLRIDADTGRVVTIGQHPMLAHLTCKPAKAIAELERGKSVYLEFDHGYVEEVKAYFEPLRQAHGDTLSPPKGIVVRPAAEAIADAEQGDPHKMARGRRWRMEK